MRVRSLRVSMLSRARLRAAAMIGPIMASSAGRGRAAAKSSTRATRTGRLGVRWAGIAGGSGSIRTESRTTSDRAAGSVSRPGSTGSNSQARAVDVGGRVRRRGRSTGSTSARGPRRSGPSSCGAQLLARVRRSPRPGPPASPSSSSSTGLSRRLARRLGLAPSRPAGSSAFSGFSCFSGSIRVSTSTGTRPLASASRSATRSPVRPSNSTLVVRAERDHERLGCSAGAGVLPSV